jgi:hypothetical protein
MHEYAGKDTKMALDELSAREIIVALVTECQHYLSLLVAYNCIVDDVCPSAKEKFESKGRELARLPLIREKVDEKLLPHYDFALRGLNEADAQKLLDRVRERIVYSRESGL